MGGQGRGYRLGALARALWTDSYAMHDAASSRKRRYVRIETERADTRRLPLGIVLVAECTDLDVPLALVCSGPLDRWSFRLCRRRRRRSRSRGRCRAAILTARGCRASRRCRRQGAGGRRFAPVEHNCLGSDGRILCGRHRQIQRRGRRLADLLRAIEHPGDQPRANRHEHGRTNESFLQAPVHLAESSPDEGREYSSSASMAGPTI